MMICSVLQNRMFWMMMMWIMVILKDQSNISSTSRKDLSGAVSKRQKGDVETRERMGKRIGSSFSVGSASGDDFGPISDPPLDFNPCQWHR